MSVDMKSKDSPTSQSTELSAESASRLSDQNSGTRSATGTDFKREIFKIVLDKFLIGLLLVLAGYYSTIVVERFKGDVSLSGELNKVRAMKMGEAWEQVYRFEGLNKTLRTEIASFRAIDAMNEAAERHDAGVSASEAKVVEAPERDASDSM